MFTPSLAAPPGEAKAVLQAIRTLLSSENHGRSEVQQSENATSAPASATSAPASATSAPASAAAGKFQVLHNASLT